MLTPCEKVKQRCSQQDIPTPRRAMPAPMSTHAASLAECFSRNPSMTGQFVQQHSFFSDCHDVSYPLPSWRGKGYSRSVCPRKGMLLYLEEYELSREMWTISDSMPPQLGFTYCISGRVQWSMDGVQREFTAQNGQCEIVSSSSASGKACYDSGDPLVMVNITLCPKLLQSYFGAPGESAGEMQCLRMPAAKDEVLYRKGPITDGEQKVLGQLLRCPCRNISDRLFIQSKVMELVSFRMDDLEYGEQEKMEQSTLSEVENIIALAKAILQSRLQSPPTIQSLARMVGTNETKLKKCFRSHLGTTVFGYLTSCRMQLACELLDNSNLTMSQIGAELGYSERTHFTRAFSRHFNMSPSQYRLAHQILPTGVWARSSPR